MSKAGDGFLPLFRLEEQGISSQNIRPPFSSLLLTPLPELHLSHTLGENKAADGEMKQDGAEL